MKMQKSSGNEAGRKSLILLLVSVSVTCEHERGVREGKASQEHSLGKIITIAAF